MKAIILRQASASGCKGLLRAGRNAWSKLAGGLCYLDMWSIWRVWGYDRWCWSWGLSETIFRKGHGSRSLSQDIQWSRERTVYSWEYDLPLGGQMEMDDDVVLMDADVLYAPTILAPLSVPVTDGVVNG